MSTPPRELILDNIQTTLEGITVAGGYKTTVTTVERLIRDWNDVQAGGRPWIGYMPQAQTFTQYAFGQMRVTMPVYIGGYIYSTSKALACEAVTNLEDDIIAAMMVDPTRGGYATLTRPVTQKDDIGDPDSSDSQGAGGALEMTFEVVYHRDQSGS